MATAHGATTTELSAPVTDKDRARTILAAYGIRFHGESEDTASEDYITLVRANFDGDSLYLYGDDNFTVVDCETGEDHAEYLLDELREVLADGAELVIRSTCRADLRWISAYQYRVTPEAVYYSDLDTAEHKLEVSQ